MWRDINEGLDIPATERRRGGPRAYRTLRLDRARLVSVLQQAPVEFSEAAKTRSVELSLPMPEGSFARFRIENSPIMAPELAAQFPEIKTYKGQSLDDGSTTTRFDLTPQGFHGIVLSPQGTVLIEPYNTGDTSNYIAYFQGEVPISAFDCEVPERDQAAQSALNRQVDRQTRPDVFSGATLRTYRLAVAATGEYTQTYGGGTVNGGLAAVVTTINLVNAIYERDVAIRLSLITNETSIIFTDPVTDGYTSNNIGALINENQTKLDSVIGTANYDIGHVFDGRLEAPGFFSFQGLASLGVVCVNGSKARGVSITRSIQPSEVVAYYSASHEIGHQFGASHTFNATTGNCASQRSASTAYEPGTGSTIMGYRFTCGAEDLMSSDTYFHNASLEQIVNFTTVGNGSLCPVTFATSNNVPAVNAGANYTIPQNTPFTLTASGSDLDGDPLTFCWEEFDLGTAAPPSTDDGTRPIFRSFAPTPDPSRTFPRLQDILSGIPTFGESLPVTTRTMNFRVTARDNHSVNGGVNSAAMQVNVSAGAGPFSVTQPSFGSSWPAGSSQTVTWNVANTNNAPVSCANVRITLSTDGGNTFPFILANSTANDGSETVVPGAPSGTARVKVEAVGNVFFNISQSFTVTGTALPTVQFSSTTSTVSEGVGSATLTVTRTGNTSGTSTVDFATSDGTASQSRDYLVESGTLTFGPGETAKVISVPIVDDAHVESSETLTVTLTNNTGASLSANTATLTITDNDAGGPSIPQKRFFAQLLGAQETPPNPSAGRGNGIVLLNSNETSALVGLQFANLSSSQLSSHIHTGAIGAPPSGPIVFGFPVPGNPISDAQFNPTAQQVSDLKAGQHFMDVHSLDFPGGEIRGQLLWNPTLEDAFFVRQHYLDFLNREADPGGLGFWLTQLHCPQGVTGDQADVQCFHDRTVGVSNAFYFSGEFQLTASFVFLGYRAAYGNTQPFPNPDPFNPTEANKLPEYGKFMNDRPRVLGGASLAQQQLAFTNLFVTRPEFSSRYGAGLNTAVLFVDAVLANIQASDGVAFSAADRTTLINHYNNAGGGNAGRAMVMWHLSNDYWNTCGAGTPPCVPGGFGTAVDNRAFIDANYNRLFALILYFGYLRRNPEIGGFLFWQNEINRAPVRNVAKQNSLVCSFITSGEYQDRFGPGVTFGAGQLWPRTNAECPP
jgi:Metallo-peptidase family M12B Reprolysin-like/Calx-beta domain/CHRD domain